VRGAVRPVDGGDDESAWRKPAFAWPPSEPGLPSLPSTDPSADPDPDPSSGPLPESALWRGRRKR
jgi:hypothetical protein